MSKKKATMTLKDFHGGSIPSDLPLPSAPGVIAKPVDRGGFERNTSWGNPMGRSDHRLRPASASSSRNLDEKTPFLSQSLHMGRNFDEDERKPLDGASGPRRTVSDEIINLPPTRPVGPRMDSFSDARVCSQPTSFPVSQVSSGSVGSSFAGTLNEVHSAGLNYLNLSGNRGYGSNYPNMGGSSGQAVSGSYPNAWGMRKETVSIKESRSAACSAPDAAKKLGHVSALEQVSSGRWNSKQSVPPLKDAEIIEHPGTEGELLHKVKNLYIKNNYNRLDVATDTDYHDVSLVMHAKRSLVIDDGIRGGVKERPTSERLKSPIHTESYERNPSGIVSGSLSPSPAGKVAGIVFPSALAQEPSERPKLKLLPRSKPLGNFEVQVDHKGCQQSSERLHVEVSHGMHEPVKLAQFGVTVPLTGDQAVEPAKLNLKPRVSSLEKLEGKAEARRDTVFGGARPRELILKERGIEDSSAGNNERQSPLRAKGEAPKVDVPPISYSERAENINQRTVKYTTDRRDHDNSRAQNRRNDIRRDSREAEKQRERPSSPESWCKPVEQPKPAYPNGSQLRHGKASSAVELAQAFSKSMADRGQVPFSRLMGPSPRHRVSQING